MSSEGSICSPNFCCLEQGGTQCATTVRAPPFHNFYRARTFAHSWRVACTREKSNGLCSVMAVVTYLCAFCYMRSCMAGGVDDEVPLTRVVALRCRTALAAWKQDVLCE